MQSETNQSFMLSFIFFPVHANWIFHLRRPSARRLAPNVRSPASIQPPTLESRRDLVSIPGRIILRTNNQTPPLLRPAINRLDNINQLLLILQHPIQLIIISRPEIAHLYHTRTVSNRISVSCLKRRGEGGKRNYANSMNHIPYVYS